MGQANQFQAVEHAYAQCKDIWPITQSQGDGIKLKKERKTHENEIYNLIYTRESQENGQHKFQEEYVALAQGHDGTKRGLPQPKGEMSAWAPNAKEGLTRAPMYRKALPFT